MRVHLDKIGPNGLDLDEPVTTAWLNESLGTGSPGAGAAALAGSSGAGRYMTAAFQLLQFGLLLLLQGTCHGPGYQCQRRPSARRGRCDLRHQPGFDSPSFAQLDRGAVLGRDVVVGSNGRDVWS